MSSPDPEFQYQGDELSIFAHATNWKKYFISRIAQYLKGDVLEVGCGMGVNTELLLPLCSGRYVCLDPDARNVAELKDRLRGLNHSVEAHVGVTGSLPSEAEFDTAIYVDVLEHIEEDEAELRRVAHRLRPGGCIIVISPAHQLLYSPFDKAIGHCRRYNRSSLLRCTPPGSRVLRMEYLDCLGGFLSLANRALLRQAYPTLEQILFWDRRVVPISRRIDPITGFRIGKSILGVWEIVK